MKELVEFITKALVKDPDAVSVTVVQKGNMEVYQIHVAPLFLRRTASSLSLQMQRSKGGVQL